MCGIAGIVKLDPAETVDEARLKQAIANVHFNWSPLITEAASVDKPPLGD